MKNKVFISFEFVDCGLLEALEKMFQEEGGTIEGRPVHVGRDISHLGTKAVKQAIHDTMEDCVLALFLAGEDVQSAPWVEHELSCAREDLEIPCFVISPPTGWEEPPKIYRHLDLLPWEPDTIAAILNHRLCDPHSRTLLRIQKRRRSKECWTDHPDRYRSQLLCSTPMFELWALQPVKAVRGNI